MKNSKSSNSSIAIIEQQANADIECDWTVWLPDSDWILVIVSCSQWSCFRGGEMECPLW